MAQMGINTAAEGEEGSGTKVLDGAQKGQYDGSGSSTSGDTSSGSDSVRPTNTAQKGASGAKSGGTSSGMFQNIKKYAAANKPGAGRMVQAVVKDVGDQASNIGKAVERNSKAFQSSLQQQQGNIQQAKDFTSGIVQNITGGGQQAPQQEPNTMNREEALLVEPRLFETKPAVQHEGTIKGTFRTDAEIAEATAKREAASMVENRVPAEQAEFSGPSAQDFTKFREHLTGGAQQFGDIADLNIIKQQQEAKNLDRITKSAETGQGRRELLKNMFAKQNPYTSGMQGLDDLIVSQDKDARTQLARGTQDIAAEQNRNIENTRSQAVKDLSGYDRSRGDFSENLMNQLTEGSSQFTDKAEESARANREKRQAIANELGITEEDAGKYMDEQFTGRGRNALTDAVQALGGRVTANVKAQKQIPEMKKGTGWKSGKNGKMGHSYTKMVPTGRMIDNPEYDPNARSHFVGGTGYGRNAGTPTSDAAHTFTSGLWDNQRWGAPTNVYSNKFNKADMELLGMEQGDLGYDVKNQGWAGQHTSDSRTSKAKHYSWYNTARMKKELDRLVSTVEDKTGRDAMLASLARGGMESTGELGTKYDDLLAGKDINAQSSASGDTISRYNSLQNLMQGMGLGDRSLQEGSSSIGTSVQNQEALAKMRADILKRIGQGEGES